jgi:hypothetical protein
MIKRPTKLLYCPRQIERIILVPTTREEASIGACLRQRGMDPNHRPSGYEPDDETVPASRFCGVRMPAFFSTDIPIVQLRQVQQ